MTEERDEAADEWVASPDQRGWVYVMTNPAMPGLVKIGFSRFDPRNRADKLAGNTGVPDDFVLEYDVLVVDPLGLESRAHQALAAHHYKKEFFRCTCEAAVDVVVGLSPSTAFHTYHRPELERSVREQRERLEREQRDRETFQRSERERLEREQDDALNGWDWRVIEIVWFVLLVGITGIVAAAYSCG